MISFAIVIYHLTKPRRSEMEGKKVCLWNVSESMWPEIERYAI